eukprot:363371-Chlamydomonas_euryale.AAC.26
MGKPWRDAKAVPRAAFGQGTLPILMDDTSCNGDEATLQSCWHISSHNCEHSEVCGAVEAHTLRHACPLPLRWPAAACWCEQQWRHTPDARMPLSHQPACRTWVCSVLSRRRRPRPTPPCGLWAAQTPGRGASKCGRTASGAQVRVRSVGGANSWEGRVEVAACQLRPDSNRSVAAQAEDHTWKTIVSFDRSLHLKQDFGKGESSRAPRESSRAHLAPPGCPRHSILDGCSPAAPKCDAHSPHTATPPRRCRDAVCDDNWGNADAAVVCRQVGLPTSGATATFGSTYGQNWGLQILMDEVGCSGSESSLQECDHQGNHDCTHWVRVDRTAACTSGHCACLKPMHVIQANACDSSKCM